jgi:ADP-ribose pyrophosphatase
MDLTEHTLSSETIYRGRVATLTVDQARLPNGASATREVVRHPKGVAVLALDEADRVVLVEQYRYPIGRTLVEIPAGKLEPGEDPRTGALRELSEEAGVEPEELIDLGSLYVSPGFCDEEIYLYLARGLRQVACHPDEDEFLDVSWMPLDRLVEQVMAGQVRDGKTVAAALKAKAWLGR